MRQEIDSRKMLRLLMRFFICNNCKWININLSSYFTNTKIDPGAILRGELLILLYDSYSDNASDCG